MSWYPIVTYLHVVTGILLVGYALFWVIMSVGLGREEKPAEATRLLGVINAGRWPPGGVPFRLRLPFPGLGWAFLLALALTGAVLWYLVGARPARFGELLGWKLAIFGALLLGQALVTRRPSRGLALLNGGLALAIVVLSALLRH